MTEPREMYYPQWVIEGVVAKAQRPGYPANRPPPEKMQEWADIVRGLGIKSILCILDDPQLEQYDFLNLDGGGLFGFYRTLGFQVAHVPADDYKRPPLSDQELDAVWEAFERLEKPVLIHCSAGRDRTGAALELILWKLGKNEDEDM
ncbi:MAG: tyrosine-protein phosphatase [Chloroflexi bacterium]|nr:tyrosine-protein phosphatase [Chloroflexota bacterium]